MTTPPLLSILTPACWERVEDAQELETKIWNQTPIAIPRGTVEHLVLYDQRTRSVGLKRQALLNAALGRYIAFVDDDDDVSADYVPQLLEAILEHPEADVITFNEDATYNGQSFTVRFQLGHPDENLILGGPADQVITRNAWHVCAWRRDKIKHCQFPDQNFGEDRIWSAQARQAVRTSHHIDKVLHYYHHDARHTLAPEPGR